MPSLTIYLDEEMFRCLLSVSKEKKVSVVARRLLEERLAELCKIEREGEEKE